MVYGKSMVWEGLFRRRAAHLDGEYIRLPDDIPRRRDRCPGTTTVPVRVIYRTGITASARGSCGPCSGVRAKRKFDLANNESTN
jgi:hypothetical protein